MIKVRFAPSPTGKLHLGSLRTAIFNWLFAKHNNGKFLLRIEDTDRERSKLEYTESILNSMKWLGLDYDGEAVYQSKLENNQKIYLEKLISENKAYYCNCENNNNLNNSSYKFYDKSCRDKKLTSGAVRFKLPDNINEVSFSDLIHGKLTFNLEQLDDFIITRSDGTSMYNFAVVIDDLDMDITHIIRGDDHINNTPKQILLYHALDKTKEMPKFAHIPLILGQSGQKLSKRDASVSVDDYLSQGYLADALFNYLVRLGWSHGDQEIFTKEELIKYFDFSSVGKSGAVFDLEKLTWLNSVYIKDSSSEKLLDLIIKDLDKDYLSNFKNLNKNNILSLINIYKPRVKLLLELKNIINSLDNIHNYNKDSLAKWVSGNTPELLKKLLAEFALIDSWDATEIVKSIKNICKLANVKMPELAQPIRLATTGDIISPGVGELLSSLGKSESCARIKKFLEIL